MLSLRSQNDMFFVVVPGFCAVFVSRDGYTINRVARRFFLFVITNYAGRVVIHVGLSSPSSLWVLFARTANRLRVAQSHQVTLLRCPQTSRPHRRNAVIVSRKVSARQYDSLYLLSKVTACTWLLLDLDPSTFIHLFPTEIVQRCDACRDGA